MTDSARLFLDKTIEDMWWNGCTLALRSQKMPFITPKKELNTNAHFNKLHRNCSFAVWSTCATVCSPSGSCSSDRIAARCVTASESISHIILEAKKPDQHEMIHNAQIKDTSSSLPPWFGCVHSKPRNGRSLDDGWLPYDRLGTFKA